MEAGKRKKITDPMKLWEAYWRASAEALVYEVRPCLDVEKTARRCKVSVMLVEMALALDAAAVDVLAARKRRRQIAAQIVEHYLSVPMNLAIEKSRQTGEDYGEYMSVAEQAMRNAITRWQLGKAPFANFVNCRIKWAFVDHFTDGRWHLAMELTEEYPQPERRESESGAEQTVWSGVMALPLEQGEVVNRFFRLNQNAREVAAAMQRSEPWVTEQRDTAVASLRERFSVRGEG